MDKRIEKIYERLGKGVVSLEDMDYMLQEYFHIKTLWCEAVNGHDWQDEPPNELFDKVHKKCSICEASTTGRF